MVLSPLRSLRPAAASGGARVVGLGSARPDRVVSADELVAPFGKDAAWLEARTGIVELRRLADGEPLECLAVTAGERALADAGDAGRDVGVVVVATCSVDPPDQEDFARRVAARLAPGAVSFVLNSACAGFCHALATARSLVTAGATRAVLVIGAEQMSRIVDPADLGTSILFADGAGAVVVAAHGDVGALGPAASSSDGRFTGLLEIPAGKVALHMDGRQVFRWAVEEVHGVAARACALAGVATDDIDVFVPHQANLRIVDAITRKLGLARAVIATDVVRSGNTSAASIPLALDALRRERRTRTGQLALLVGFGAGLSIAGQVIRLP